MMIVFKEAGLRLAVLLVGLSFVAHVSLAADIRLPWLNGTHTTSYSTADHPSSVFVLEFYQNRCGACNANAPKVSALAGAYHHKRVQVLDIGIDRPGAQYDQWIGRHRPNHPVLGDYNRALMRELNIKATPTTLVLDCKLQERWRHVGAWSAAVESKLRSLISHLAAESCRR